MIGTIDVKTRPLKLAYLIDPKNTKQVKSAIQLSSTLWGGEYFPILPLCKRMPATWKEGPIKNPTAQSVLLGYIESFDPDIFVQFSKEIPEYINKLDIQVIKPEEVWEILDNNKHLSPQFGLGIFEILSDIFNDHFKFKAKYPINLILPKFPRELNLFWISLFGEIPKKLLPILENTFFKPLSIKAPTFKIKDINKFLAGNVRFPRRITNHKLTNYRHSSSSGRNAYIYFLDATKIEDIIDFWNLRALGRIVLPMPKQLTENEDYKKIIINFLKRYRIPWPHNNQVCDNTSFVKARNCTMEEMEKYTKTLVIEKKSDDPSNTSFFTLQHWYPRIWDEWARDKDDAIQDNIYGDEEDSIEVMDTKDFKLHSLLPNFAQKYGYHGKPRCSNEISFRFYGSDKHIAEVYPKSSGDNFIKAISGLTSFRKEWRVGKNGLVKIIRDDFSETKDIPLAENVFFAWLKDLGWDPKLSPPGILAKQIFKTLKGNTNIIKNEKLLGILEYMNGGSVKSDGNPKDNNVINQTRYSSIAELKSKLNTTLESKNDALYNYLIDYGIFKIGLRVQCQDCLRNSWYSLENIKDLFLCPLCLNTFSAVGNLDSSTWSYKTIGPFSLPQYADGAYSVLLTIAFFYGSIFSTLRLTPAFSFTAKESSNSKILEADIGAFWQDSIYGEKREGIFFAECKTYNQFDKKDFERMRYLAKTFPGAILIFSTLRKSLTPKEISEITKIAKSGRKYWKLEQPINPILILTGNELFNKYGPPLCWDDTTKKKFDRVRDLIELCDITQQIYLNLPSWHTEWLKKWGKKSSPRKSKK